MALFELTGTGLAQVEQSTFTELRLLERANIQRAIRAHINAITPGVKTMVLAEEFGEWVDANRRIDLLCLDDERRLVVVELKRDNSAHMELQALRYAAMVSALRFDQAVEAHRKYLRAQGSDADAEQAIRAFLDEEDQPIALADSIRIVLAASDFSSELTTAVLWLNKQGLDIRCVQMRPHTLDGRVLLDIQQVIPLPAAAQYQVALREKTQEQAVARSQARDTTRYDLSVGDATQANLPKKRLIYEVVAEAIRRGVDPERIAAAVPWRKDSMFVSAAGQLKSDALKLALGNRPLDRHYAEDGDLFYVDGKTYAISDQWGHRTIEAIDAILEILPQGEAVGYSPTTPVAREVAYGSYVIRQRESGTIELTEDGVPVEPVKPRLRDLAVVLGVDHNNPQGRELNTRTLGERVMRAVQAF
ncbi:MAG: hypothetical protein J0I65_25930 [Variovorax sp.]|nr:hypothetical protein [Variovorax sp.]